MPAPMTATPKLSIMTRFSSDAVTGCWSAPFGALQTLGSPVRSCQEDQTTCHAAARSQRSPDDPRTAAGRPSDDLRRRPARWGVEVAGLACPAGRAPRQRRSAAQAVLAAISELGYRPSSAASSLAGNRTRQHRRRHRRLPEPVVRRTCSEACAGCSTSPATPSRSPTGTSTRTSSGTPSTPSCRCRWRASSWRWRPADRFPTWAASRSSWREPATSYPPGRTSSPTTTPRGPGSPPST